MSPSTVVSAFTLFITCVASQNAADSSPSSSSPGYEIHFPASQRRAHAVVHLLKPLNVSSLFLSAELFMATPTDYPFFLSYAVEGEPNELALAVPGSAHDRSYTLLMGKNGVARNDVSRFPLGGV